MNARDVLGKFFSGLVFVAIGLLVFVLVSSISQGGIAGTPGEKKPTPTPTWVQPPLEPTGTFTVPTPEPIPSYTPVPTLPAGEFVVTRTIALPREMTFLGWSPDGQRILIGKWLGYHNVGSSGISFFELWAGNYDGSGMVKLASEAMTKPAWSPDGQSVAYMVPLGPEGPKGEIRVVDTRDQISRVLAQGDIGLLSGVQWLSSGEVAFPSGGILLGVSRDGGPEREVSNAGNEVSLAVPAGSNDEYWVSPDGKSVAFLHGGYIWIAGLDGSNPVLVSDRGVLGLGPPVWAPDSSKLAWVTWDGGGSGSMSIWQVNADGSGKREVIGGDPDTIGSNVSWSSDGKVLAFSGRFWEAEETIRLINSDGTDLRVLDTSLTGVSDPLWSPDGKKIAIYKMASETTDQHDQLFVLEIARR